MHRPGFLGVTCRAGLLRLAPVGFVAIRARLVPGGRRAVLLFVAAAAGCALRARVRLVAIRARLVPACRRRMLAPVTRLAADFRRLRVMRQALMALRASLVPGVRVHLGHALLVAPFARREIRERELEVVRPMAALAGDAPVKVGVRVCGAVARIALGGDGAHPPLIRMRVVAAGARAASVRRMARLDRLVTGRARSRWSRAHVVRRMAIRATVVGRNFSATDDGLLRMTRIARERFFGVELVRLMATRALGVTAREQGRRRHDGLLLGVARGARR